MESQVALAVEEENEEGTEILGDQNPTGVAITFISPKSISVQRRRGREFTKMIGASWNNLSAEEKAVYQGIGLKDKERYKKEKKEYIERRKQMMQGTSGSETQSD